MGARALVGTSGYVYADWRRRFYPAALPARDWLSFYARRFPTVELNNPFYRLPAAENFAAWRRAVPPGFVYDFFVQGLQLVPSGTPGASLRYCESAPSRTCGSWATTSSLSMVVWIT